MARFWRRSPAKGRAKHSRRALGRKPSLTRWSGPFLEPLENRMLLAFTPTVTGTSVKFTSDDNAAQIASDPLYLQTDPSSGDLEWQDNSSSTWHDLGFVPGKGGNTTVTFTMYNPVVLQTIVGGGGNLTFEGYAAGNTDGAEGFVGPSKVTVNGNIHTEGGGLTIQYAQDIEVNANFVLSTRELASYSGLTPSEEQNSPSTGNSGAITLGVGNVDPVNSILNIDFQTPQINIDSGALVLANTTTGAIGQLNPSQQGYAAGPINFTATNLSYNEGGVGLLGDDLSLLAREADIYVGTSAVLRGNAVSLGSQGGDVNLIAAIGNAAAEALPTSYSGVGSEASLGAKLATVLTGGLATLQNKIPGLKSILSPTFASFIFKDGTARVEVEQSAQIIADGNVTISATADSAAYGQATTSNGSASNNQNQNGILFSVSAAYAQSNTYAMIDSGAAIDAGGSVSIETSGTTNPKPSASVEQNVGSTAATPPANVKQIGIAVGISNETSQATVAQGATITAGGDITVNSGGTGGNQNTDISQVQTQTYYDGSAGVAININLNFTNVQAEADGTLSADLSQVNNAGASTLTFNPFTQADLADSVIDFGQADGYKTGDQITYQSGPGGPIGGLTSGQTYYVIVVDADRIRLASTAANAQAGNFIVFTPYPTLEVSSSAALPAGTSLTFAQGPVLSASAANTTLTFTPGPTMSGSPTLAFTPAQASSPATIERSTGNWTTDGFLPGDLIAVSGTLANNGIYTIDSISLDGSVLALEPAATNLAPEVSIAGDVAGLATLTASSGSWITDGFQAGQTIQVAGTNSHNGSYLIEAVSSDGTTLYLPPNTVASETGQSATVTATAGLLLSGTVTLASGNWSNYGFAPGDSISVTGTAHNNGTYTIQSINGTTLSIAPESAGLQAESTTSATIKGSTQIAVTQVNELGNRLAFAFDPGLSDGQAVVYHAVPGQLIGGLTDGQTYYAIRNIVFGSVAVDTTADTLSLSADPGFAQGQPVVFESSSDAGNLGLIPGHTYDVVVDDSEPDVIQLTDPTAADPTAIVPLRLAASGTVTFTLRPVQEIGLSATEFGPPVELYLSPQFTGSLQTVSAGLGSNELTLNFATGFQEGDAFVFQGAKDTGTSATDDLGLTVGNLYYPVADPNNANAFFIAGSLEDAVDAYNDLANDKSPSSVLTLSASTSSLTFSFNPLASTDGTNDTIDMGFNVGDNPSFINGTPLVYHGALGTTLNGLAEGHTYYAIIDPVSPRLLRLAASPADAVEAYGSGESTYNTDATAAPTNTASLGEAWFNQGVINALTAGAASGPYTVSVSKNEIVFQFSPGLNNGDEVDYAGALPGQQAIDTGGSPLAAGTYFAVPDGSNADAIGLATTYGGTPIPLSLAPGSSTQIQISIGMPQGPFPVTVSNNELVLPFPSGFAPGEQITYLGPASGYSGVAGLTAYIDYYVIPDPANPDAFGLATTSANVLSDTLVPLTNTSAVTDILLGPSLPGTTPAVVNSAANTLTLSGMPVYFSSTSAGTQNLVVAASSSLPVGTELTFDAGSDVSTTDNTVSFAAADGLSTGNLVTYENPTQNPDIGGLTSGLDYYVLVVNPTTIQLLPASPIALATASQGTQSLVVVSSNNPGLSAGTALPFDGAANVDTTANTITYTLPSGVTSGLKSGDEVVYVNNTGNADIGGLTSGSTYTVVAKSRNSVQLTQTFATDPGWGTGDLVEYLGNGDGTSDVTGLNVGQDYYVAEQSPGVLQFSAAPISPVALKPASSGTQSLVVQSSANAALNGTSLSFDAAAGVDTTANTIAFSTPDGLETGDKVEYENNSGNPDIGGLTSGDDYYVVTVDPSTIELTTSQTMIVSLGTASSVSASGATPQVILAAPLGPQAGPFADTRGGAVLSFEANTTVMTGVASSISAAGNSSGTGVSVTAELSSSLQATASAGLGNESVPFTGIQRFTVGTTRGGLSIGSQLMSQFLAVPFDTPVGPDTKTPPTRNPAAANSAGALGASAPSGTGNTSAWEFAGAFTVVISQDTVLATVGGHAVIESGAGVNVRSSLEQQYLTVAQGSLTRSGPNGKAFSLALDLAVFDEEVHATVDSGATIDAYGSIAVSSSITYPFAFDKGAIAVAASGVAGTLGIPKSAVPVLSQILGVIVGGASFEASSLAQASAVPAQGGSLTTAGAGAVTVDVFINDCEATIGDAAINQNTGSEFRGSAGDPNTKQSVAVSASTTYDSVGIDGVLNLSVGGLSQAISERSLSALGGPSASGTAAGGAIDINVMDNTTLAQIQSGAQIHIGSAGSLAVDATQSVISVNLDGAGASGGNVGFAGTLVWNNLYTSTKAQIEQGVAVNAAVGDTAGGPVHVLATDNVIVVGVAGGFGTSQHSGFGLTVAVNNFNRETLALIGDTSDQTPTPGQNGDFNISGLQVNAVTQGVVAGLSFAAASASSAGKGGGSSGSGGGAGGSSGGASSAIAGASSQAPGYSMIADVAGLAAPASGVGGASSGADASATSGPSAAGQQSGTAASGDASLNILQTDTEAYVNDPGTFNTGPAPTAHTIVTSPTPSGDTAVNFAAPPGLTTGQPVEYQTAGTAIGGLTSGTTYYAIPVSGNSNEIELASSFANALAGHAISLDYSKASGAQTLRPISTAIEAAAQTVIVSLAGGFAFSFTSSKSNLGVAGAFSYNEINDTTYAYLSGATLTTSQLDVTATHSGIIVSLTAGAAGAPLASTGPEAGGVAGSVSVDVVLPDTEAYVQDATVNLIGDSNVVAQDQTQIWSIAGALGFGGEGGYGVAVAVNLIGFSWGDDNVAPAKTLAFIKNSAITVVDGTLTVDALSANPGDIPRIVAITGAVGVALASPKSLGGAGMISVNVIDDQTEAYLLNSSVTDVAAPSGVTATVPANLVVDADDTSEIVSIGGAVGVGQGGVGAGFGYNQIDATIQASLDGTSVTNAGGTGIGTVSVNAESHQTIGGAVVGVGVSTGPGWGVAGSISVNLITDSVDAHIATNSNVQAEGTVTVGSQDDSLIAAIAGAIAVSVDSPSPAIGASISYNRISNGLAAYIDSSTVSSAQGAVDLSALSSPLLISIGAAGSGGTGVAGAGTITINSIANTVDAHISSDSTVTASSDVTVNSSEAASEYVAALGIAGSTGGAAIGAAIAYNFIGGVEPGPDPNYISFDDGTVAGTQNAVVLGDGAMAFSTAIIIPNNGFNTGDAVVYNSKGDAAIGGLTSGQTYYVIKIDDNTIKLASSLANADNGIAIATTSTGNDAQTLTRPASTPAVTFNPTHNAVSGNEIYPVTVQESSGTLVITSNGPTIAITGGDAKTSLLGSPSTTSATAGKSISGTTSADLIVTGLNDTLSLTVNGSPRAVTLQPGTYTPEGLATALQSAINGAVFNQEGLITGEQVIYQNNGGTSIDGLQDGASYYIIQARDNGIELGSTPSATTPVALGPDLGSGTGHTLTPLSSTMVSVPQSAVGIVPVDNQIGFGGDPGLYTGEPLVYHANGGTPIGGLTDGTTYYVISLTTVTGNPTLSIAPPSGSGSYPNDPTVTRSAGSWFSDGFRPGQTIYVAGATNSGNDGAFTIDGISTDGTVLYLVPNAGESIKNETDSSGLDVSIADPTQIELAATANDADNGNAIPLTSAGSGSFTLPVPTSGVTAYIANSTVTSKIGRVLVLSGYNDPATQSDPGPLSAGTQAVNPSTDVITTADAIHLSSPDGLTTGQEVVYHDGGGSPIDGLQDGHTYYVIAADSGTIQLASTYDNEVSGAPVQDDVQSVTTSTASSNPNQITLASDPGLYTGEAIVYSAGGNGIGGLTDGGTYFVIQTSTPGVIRVASSLDDANNGTAIPLSSAGKGSFAVPTASTPISFSSTGGASQTITPIDTSRTATFDAEPYNATKNPSGQKGGPVPIATWTVTANAGILTMTSNGAAAALTGGDGETSLLGSSPTTPGNSIIGSAAANLKITAGTNDTLDLTVDGASVTVKLAAGTYSNVDALVAKVQKDLNNAMPTVSNVITFNNAPGFNTGDEVVYHNGSGSNQSVGGLTDGNTYYVIKINDFTIQLASTAANAASGNDDVTLNFSQATGSGHSLTPTLPAEAQSFGSSDVTTENAASDEIQVAGDPGWHTGDAVIYQNGAGSNQSIGGLTDGQTYFIIKLDATHIKLAATLADALDNQPVFLTSTGTGTNHSLVIKLSQVTLAGVTVPLPTAISGQLVSVTIGGAGSGEGLAFAGALSLNFVRMNVDAHISGSSVVQAAGDVDVLASDTSKIGSGAGSLALSFGGGVSVNASVGVNDIQNSVNANVEGSKVTSTLGAVDVAATERAQDVNVVVGGAAGFSVGNSFGGSLGFNFIKNTVDAHISGSGGVGGGGTSSQVQASGDVSVQAQDTASVATLAGNIDFTTGGNYAAGLAFSFNDVSDTVHATIDNSGATSQTGDIMVNATFAKPTDLPPGLDVQIAAMAVDGAGATKGAGAGSVALNWIHNDVEAKVSNIAAPSQIKAAGELGVTASDNSTINSLAGAFAIAGIGAKGASAAVGASVSLNYLGGDPATPGDTTDHNMVIAAIENSTGIITAGQIVVKATYNGRINNITLAGAAAGTFGLGGAVSVNIIRNTADAHISGARDVVATSPSGQGVSVSATDTSTIEVLAGGVGIAIATKTPVGIAAGVSVASNEIYNTIKAYVDSSKLTSASNINLSATSTPLVKALTIGVAVAVSQGEGGIAGSGAGAGSGNTVENTVLSYISDSQKNAGLGVAAGGTITVSANDNPTIDAVAGALSVGVAVGSQAGVAGSVGISVSINEVSDTVEAYISNSTLGASGGDLTVQAIETGTINAWTIGGAVGVGSGGNGIGVGLAGAGSGNTVTNQVYAYIAGGSSVTTSNSGDVIVTAGDTSGIQAIGGGLGVGVGVGLGSGGVSLGVAAANNDIADTVTADVDASNVSSAGGVQIKATENATIFTITVGGAVAVGVGDLGGAGVAVAGSDSTNAIENTVKAYVDNGSTVTARGGDVSIAATDTSSITAGGGGLAVGVGVGTTIGVAAAVGFAAASNDVDNDVEAYVSDSQVSDTGYNVTICAKETATLVAITAGGAVAVGVGTIAGAASGAGGNATNTVSNTVEAYLEKSADVSTTTSGNVSLTATDLPNLTAKTVAASVSFAAGVFAETFAIGAALATNDVEDTVAAYSDNSSINSSGTITITATATANPNLTGPALQAVSVAAAVAVTAAPYGAAYSGAGASSTTIVDNTISSYITGLDSQNNGTTAGGDISISATENLSSNSIVGSGAAAGAAAGASVGVSTASVGGDANATNPNSTIKAYVDDAPITSKGGSISIGASSSDTTNALAIATSIAASDAGAGGNASVDVSPAVEAYAGSGASLNASKAVSVTASSANSASAQTYGVAVAIGLAIGTSTTAASTNGSVKAHVDGLVTGSDSLTVQATATDTSNAQATAFSGGIISGDGAAATATTSPTVSAYTLNNITATNAVQVTATVVPQAIAQALGVAVGEASIGVSITSATVSPDVTAYVGSGSTIDAGSLTISATQEQDAASDPTANAYAVAGAGGELLGVQATLSTATDNATVEAYAENSVTLPDGDVTIAAFNQTAQSAYATAAAVGLVAAGGSNATASSGVTTSANLGTFTQTHADRTGGIDVRATGSDSNTATGIAGSGGLFAANGTDGVTNDTSTVSAGIGAGSSIYAGGVVVSAENADTYTPNANAITAGAVAGGGAYATAEDVDSNGKSEPTSATVNIGDTSGVPTTILASGTVTVTAQNNFAEGSGGGAEGGAGGALGVGTASSSATLAGNSSVTLGNQVSITSGSAATPNPGGIALVASSTLSADDLVTLSSGGAIAGAGINSTLNGTLTNSVTTGTSDALDSTGNIGLGTYTTVDAQTNAEGNTYGLGGVPKSTASTDVTTGQSVTVGQGTTMTAVGDVDLTPGNEPSGQFNTSLSGLSNAQSYFYGLIGVPLATATTDLKSNAMLTIDSSATIQSGQNVTIGAFPGAPAPTADGTAHYDGGQLSTSASTSTPSSSVSSQVIDNGTITAGIYHELDITIPDKRNSGIFTDQSQIQVNPDGAANVPFTATFDPSFLPSTENAFFDPATSAALDSNTSATPVGALTFGPLFAAGGIVTVNASSLSGTGTIIAQARP